MPSAWIKHAMAYHKAHPGGSYASSLKAAAKTWKSKKASAGTDEKTKKKKIMKKMEERFLPKNAK